MQHARYRLHGQRALLALTLPGTELDFAALDRAAAARWGANLRRIASWLR